MEKVEVKAEAVDWLAYFQSIRHECPWSLAAYKQGLIDIVEYQGRVLPLGDYQARVYIVTAPEETVEALAAGLDYDSQDEWLFSYPGYGPFAAPRPILIQQDRSRLEQLRKRLDEGA